MCTHTHIHADTQTQHTVIADTVMLICKIDNEKEYTIHNTILQHHLLFPGPLAFCKEKQWKGLTVKRIF